MSEPLTTKQACEKLGCKEDKLREYRKAGKIKFCKIGKEFRYLIDDLSSHFGYATHGDNNNVVDFGKRKLEAKQCQSINAGKRGGLTTPMSTTSEYASLLGLK